MTRRFGLGLRAQIIVALSAAFILSFTLLGVAAVQLSGRARSIDRERSAEATARVIAVALERASGDRRVRSVELADAVIGTGGIEGVEVTWPGIAPHVRGLVGTGTSASAPMARGGSVRVWIRAPADDAASPMTDLLMLYVSVTGGTILLLTYVALTHLIVRPVAVVTHASERLAAGGRHVDVPVRGAAEVARLAIAFNQMAAQLRTERQALEDRVRELEQTTTELDTAHDHLVRSERLASVGRLAAGVAHEIGNPLAAILGLVELVRAGDLEPAEREEFLRRVQLETERIQKIIRDLLDFSRQGRDEEDADATADLGEVVEDAVRLVAPQKDLNQVDIERRVDPDVPRVRGSADRLGQLVLNLLLNAADAIGGEGSIRLEVHAVDGIVELVVADSGPGIPPTVMDELFEPFVTTKPAGQGTGLGLAVCHTIVERLGGSIEAENAPGGGARFVVRLPAST